jgi:predicted phosphodiesterase
MLFWIVLLPGDPLLKKFIKILFIVALAYAIGRLIVVYEGSRLTGNRAPYIQMLTSDSVIIHWLTDENQPGVVQFGEDSNHLATVVREELPVKNHIVKLSGLKPATRYYYQVGENSSSQVFDPDKHWFYTSPVETVPTRVWVIGDSGAAGEISNQVRDAALTWMKKNPLLAEQTDDKSNKPLIDVWIALGDIAYQSGTNEQFQAALFDTFGGLTANTALWPVYGNHDSRRWTYFRIFDLPENAEAGGAASHTENYYSIDFSNIHFVILDSQASDRSETGEMANWLKRDLEQNTKLWVIAALHHPPYTKGSHDSDDSSDSRGRMWEMRNNIVPILEQAGVDLVLSGHSHMYERSYLMDCAYNESAAFSTRNIVSTGVNKQHQQYIKPQHKKEHQGTVYVVAGSASRVDHGPLDHPAHPVGLEEAGSVVIDVDNNKLITRFINNKGQVRDEFSITKEVEYESKYQGCLN